MLISRLLYFTFFAFICLNANAQLNADFTSNIQEGCTPLVVQFLDNSTGDPTEWIWDLGNGAPSDKKNPGAIYINPGSYTVKLYVKNAAGEDSITKVNYIIVHEDPTAALSATPIEGCAPLNISFTDSSSAGSGTINSWLWDFGDGLISTQQNPSHIYNIADTFDVVLTVTNNFGCKNTLKVPSLIKVASLLRAGFTYTYDNVCKPPATVTFNNTSVSGTTASYQWLFGDGAASTDKNPVHTYTTSGDFIVLLTVVNATGCTQTYQQQISVGRIEADFSFTNGCVNEPIVFTDQSVPKPISQTWDFGDGQTATGLRVEHIYTTSGTYQVTLITDFGGCLDTIRKTVQTVEKITADFTESGDIVSCNYPVTINFTNTTQNSTTYRWIFGDGASTTLENPTHTYNNPGQYTVTLIAFNSTGCSDTLTKVNLIRIGPPQIQSIQNLPFEGCVPQTITLTPVIVSPEVITSYQWDFGDGNTSAEPQPTHTFANAGIYNVRLIVSAASGCSDTLFLQNAVLLGNPPVPLFGAEPLQVCAEKPVQFTDSSTGFITEWLWLFGDQGTSSEQNPTHIYTDTGYFDVTLIVGQYGCFDTLTIENYIYVKAPIAKFTRSFLCSNPYDYNFNDTSVGAETWLWDFGDGNTSNVPDIKHTYASTGVFYASLTVTNGSCTDIKEDTIKVIAENPSFGFESVSANFCKYDSILFFATNYTPGNIRAFQWNFGDGITTSASINNSQVYHLYNTAGIYYPKLIVQDINLCRDTIGGTVPIEIFGPNAAFSNLAGDCLFSTINFADESTGDGKHAITKWIWNYGDGTIPETLTSGPFNHTYNQKGSFNVSLKITDELGCYDSIININAVDITQPIAGFYTTDTLKCSKNDIQFFDSSDGVSLLYNWDFGDGNTSTNPEPKHVYQNEGLYSVKLVLQDKYGCKDSMLKPNYVLVANPVAAFTLLDSVFLCPPVQITPTNNSGNYNSLTWDFGDGNTSSEIEPTHHYTTADNYMLRLVVNGYGNCYDTLTKPIIVKGPSAELSYSPVAACDSLNVSFEARGKNTIEYIWDFGDGEVRISKDSNANYTYLQPGKFLPVLVITDTAGCKVSVVTNDTIIVSAVDAKFSATLFPGTCDSSRYDFTDMSVPFYDTISNYTWQFGDGGSSFQSNPLHFYTQHGLYNASLAVTTKNGCVDNYQLPVNVFFDTATQIFATIPDSACVNALFPLTAGVINPPGNLNWKWNFGDGSNGYSKDTSYSYTMTGTYTLSLVGTNTEGCADTVYDNMRIDALPGVNAGADAVICKGQSIVLNATGADTYTWLADATLSCTDCASPNANPLFNHTYFLTGTNNFGCKANDSVNIEVKQPLEVSVTGPDTSCAGRTIHFQATGAELYEWQPAGIISGDSLATTAPLTTTEFLAIGKDDKGCFTDTALFTVNVFPYPTLQIPDSVITISAGNEHKVETIGSQDIIFWQWSPLAGLSCTNCAEPIIKPRASQTYTVNAQNIAGCSVERQVNVTVLCKDQNLFIPNTFSPNADGMNDYFYPRGKGLFTVKSFRIFSRIGTIVFERTNFPPNQQSYGWDGKYIGKALQPDVYVFVVDVLCDNGTVLSTKGNVTLLR